jgi:hypothetical protein
MEDEQEDLMSIFGSGQDLNFESQYFDTDEEDDTDVDDDSTKPNNSVEGEDSEDVDGDEDESSEESDSDDESSPNLYSSISDVLIEQGILPSLESSKDIKDVDSFTLALKAEIDTQATLKANHYLENLDLESIAQSKKASVDLENMDEEYLKDNLESAKNIILQDYVNQGLPEERARKMLRTIIDAGNEAVIEEALESKESLKAFELKKQTEIKAQYEQNLKAQKLEQEKIDTEIKKLIFESKEIIKGIPNTKAIGDKVFKVMTEVVAKNPQTGELENKFMNDRSKDPIQFDTRMYYLYELTNGFTDLSKIKTTVTSKVTKNLEQAIRKTKFEDNGTPGYLQDPDSYSSGYGSELVL